MKIPVDNYNDLLTVLKLEHFGPLFEYFDYHARCMISMYIISNALENSTLIPTQEEVSVTSNIFTDQEKLSTAALW